MKKVLFLTGTRADFGKIKPLIKSLCNQKDFDCHIFVTGMHLLKKYGLTVIEVENEFSECLTCFKNQSENNNKSLDLILSKTIEGFNRCVAKYEPDLIILHGDRVETLAGACVGSMNNIRTAHIEGGEVSGTIDELMRHAISKLSHIHFVANEDAKNRLVQMGEARNSIFIIGSPDIDLMLSDDLPSIQKVKKHYGIIYEEYSIFCYHPVTTELSFLEDKANQIYKTLDSSEDNFIVIESNNDPGTEVIKRVLKPLKKKENFKFFPSLRHEYFLTLLKHANYILGNSSTCVREAPIFLTPSISLGSRQNNRYSYPTIFVAEEDKESIEESIKLAKLKKTIRPSLYFGKGNSVKKFIKIINDNVLWNIDLQKSFIDKTLDI